MITKNDLFVLLTQMEKNGINITNEFNTLLKSPSIPITVLKFINDNRQLDVTNFYTYIRKNYNNKKSNLYKNIVKEELSSPEEVLTTLAALNLQILLYAKNLEDNQMFLRHSRIDEILQVLENYTKTYDLIPCFKLLKLIKTDLKVLESIQS